MTQFILTKESPEIIRFFRNISTLSKMLDDQEKNFRPESVTLPTASWRRN